MKTLKISEPIHSQLRISAANNGCSLQSLAEGFITSGLAELLKRKAPLTQKRFRKVERV